MLPYDPLEYENLARSVVSKLMSQPEHKIPPRNPFEGPGVYALFYRGSFGPYQQLLALQQQSPIYVGKAVPAGARKGQIEEFISDRSLFNRLKQHSTSIDQATNLDTADFFCRYLVVIPVWITLAERFLIEHYRPLWNVYIDGFGNHNPGKGRSAMRRPRWDVLHPGRSWAEKLRQEETPDQIISDISGKLSG
jgi:hypothetical protein